MAKPNLFIVGAPKCGTTAWYEYLRGHPDIFFPDVKEPSHFLTDFPRWPQISDRAEYLRLFDESSEARIIGEASPHHLYSEEAARNIREFNPDAKIIILVRDRADYLQSLYNEHLFNGVETIKDFKLAWELSGKRNSGNTWAYCKEPKLLDYRKSAEFSPQVERFFAAFPAEQIRVFRFDDWTRSPRQTYLEILKFLDVEDDGRTNFEVVNEAHHHGAEFVMKFVKMPPAPVKKLVRLLRKLAGREGLGVGKLALGMSRRQGKLIEVDPVLKAAIRKQYEHDDELLEPRISSIPAPDPAQRAA